MSARQVVKNSFWDGMELIVGIATVMISSVVLSRAFGPERLGDYTYFAYLTYIAGVLSTGGLQSTTLKFITEFLSKGEPGTAYLIYRMAWRIQMVLAIVPVLIAIPLVWYFVTPESRWMATFLVISMTPRMLGLIPAQVNSATQKVQRNFLPAMVSNLLTLAIILLAVKMDWGPTGLALAQPVGCFVDLVIKQIMTAPDRNEWKRALAPGAGIDPALRVRFRRFAASGVGLLLLTVVVWDRSDLVLLRHLNPDIRQVTFFSYSYTLVEKLQLVPRMLAGALGLNMLARQALDRQRMAALAVSSSYYLLLIGLPVMLGAVAVSRPLWMIYGDKFAPAVPVFIIMAVLAIPRTVQLPAGTMLQAADQQNFLLWTGVVCAVVNLAVDVVLIPSYGAVGAALGNGIAQALGAMAIWVFIKVKYAPDLMPGRVGRVVASGMVMAGIVYGLTLALPPVPGAVGGIIAGVLIYVGMLRLTGALGEEDRGRLESVAGILPVSLRYPVNRLLWHLIPNAQAR